MTFLVLNTGYTAVVTTRLLQEATTEVTSLEEAIASNYRFCVGSSIRPGLEARYPGISALIVENTAAGNFLDALDADVCDAAIYTENSWRRRRSFGGAKERHYCQTKVRLTETIFEFPNAIPVRNEIAQAVSAAIQADVEMGEYTRLEHQARLNYTYAVCPEAQQQGVKSKFGLGDLGGMLLLLFIMAVVSLLVTRFGHNMEKGAKGVANNVTRRIAKAKGRIIEHHDEGDGEGVDGDGGGRGRNGEGEDGIPPAVSSDEGVKMAGKIAC